MTTPDTLELRRKAEAATPGPWRLFLATDARPHNVSGPARWRGPDAETASLFDVNHYGSMKHGYGPEQTANAAFIAAANPAVIIDLLDRLDALEGALRRQTDNMAFILNRVDLHAWQDKFDQELSEDREFLPTTLADEGRDAG